MERRDGGFSAQDLGLGIGGFGFMIANLELDFKARQFANAGTAVGGIA